MTNNKITTNTTKKDYGISKHELNPNFGGGTTSKKFGNTGTKVNNLGNHFGNNFDSSNNNMNNIDNIKIGGNNKG